MTRVERLWKVHPRDDEASAKLSAVLGIRRATAQILLNRGLDTPEKSRAFLWDGLSNLTDPSRFRDMDLAVQRIHEALASREKILVYGDYDVDGVTATALLVRFFNELHGDVESYIPHRIDEGYGMHVDRLASFREQGVGLIVTVDNGITAVEEVAEARRLGMDVVVTDHHETEGDLPDAVAVLNPKRPDATYPFRDLAGVGVAFKLAWALAQKLSGGPKVSAELREFLVDALGLVALGTVADVVPLLNENRIFVRYGLKSMVRSRNPGLKALLAVCNLMGKKPAAHDLAFRLGPRVNAAGRLGDSETALQLFTATSYSEALTLARKLETHNRRRQEIEALILEQALGMLTGPSADLDPVLVLAREDWHAGVLGIVASKIAERYHRPAVLISLTDGMGKGSARSIPSFHVQQAFAACRDRLLSFGGHAQAAGLTIAVDELEAFRSELNDRARPLLEGEASVPFLDIEFEVELSELDRGFVAEIEQLRPFGAGNREPLLVARNLVVAGQPRRMGRDGRHLSFYARDATDSCRVIAFGQGDRASEIEGQKVDLVFVPRINAWRGRQEVELNVKDIKVHA